MLGMYRNLDLSDNIFDCLLTAVAKVQSVNRKAPFLLVGDVNAHHGEWLRYSSTNWYGRVARDFASSSGCEQMVTEPTHINGGVLHFPSNKDILSYCWPNDHSFVHPWRIGD